MNWKAFCKVFCKKLWKKINAWSIRRLVNEIIIQHSDPAYYIEDCRIYNTLADFSLEKP